MTEIINPIAERQAVVIANYSPYPYKSIQWQIEWQKAYYEYLEKLELCGNNQTYRS